MIIIALCNVLKSIQLHLTANCPITYDISLVHVQPASLIQINSGFAPHPSKFSTNRAYLSNCDWLTGIVSQVLLMNCSLSVDWLYVSVILQLLRTPGTTYGIQGYVLKEANEKINY